MDFVTTLTIVRELRTKLSYITDLLELLSVQDKVANRAKDIAGLMLGRRMVIPEPLFPAFKAFVSRSIDAAAQALTAMNELDELLETGFAGREVSDIDAGELENAWKKTDDQG